MKRKKIIRNYTLKDNKLLIIAKSKIAFIRRDMEQFNTYGITENDLVTLNNKIDAFFDMLTDAEIKETQNERTLEKKEKAVALIEAINDLMAIVGRRFKKDSARYHGFGIQDLIKQSDSKLYITAITVVKMGTKYLAELVPFGLNTSILNTISTLNVDYEEKLLNQLIGSVDRKYYREERVLLSNEIYALLSSYAAVGKSIWETKSVAKTNDYMIYKGQKEVKTVV